MLKPTHTIATMVTGHRDLNSFLFFFQQIKLLIIEKYRESFKRANRGLLNISKHCHAVMSFPKLLIATFPFSLVSTEAQALDFKLGFLFLERQ